MKNETRLHTATLRRAILAAAALALAAALAAIPRQDEAKTMSGPTRTYTYVHLYSDANGVSHFRDETVKLESTPGPHGEDGALSSYTLRGTQEAQFLALKHGAREDWHNAPRRMFLIVLQGTAQVTASDGQVRRFGPGSMLLMDDPKGKGHITEVVGKVDHVTLTIPWPLH
jgi:mannose-6-phosphate isomerase-like protein (cupin superfamily)